MAKKEEQKQRSAAEQRKEKREVMKDRLRLEYEITEAKQTFTEKRERLANRAAELVMERGKDHYLTQILLTFLDVTILMEDTINVLTDVQLAMECITEAIECMDGIMDMNRLALQSTLKHKYGFFARLKAKREMRKVMRNNIGRMQTFSEQMIGMSEMAQDMGDALRKSCIKMQSAIQKRNEKRKKHEVKVNPTGAHTPSAAEVMVDEIVRSKGGTPETSSPDFPSSAASAPAGGGKPSDTGDISDII